MPKPMTASPIVSEEKPSPGRSWLRRIVISLLIIVGFAMMFYVFENWRGNRAWKKYEQEAKAKGVPLDWRTDWPKRPLTAEPINDREFPSDRTFDQACQLLTSSVVDDEFEDLVAWEQAIEALKSGKTPNALRAEGFKIVYGNTNATDRARAAEVVLEIFKADEAFFEQVRAACHRPDPLYPFWDPSEVYLLHLAPRVFACINMARMLRVKAAAELAAGHNAAALRDLDLLLCLSESLRNDPLLISHIGHVATLKIGLRFPWEGLALRQFTDSELKQLQEMLGEDDLIANCHGLLVSERAAMLPLFDRAKRDFNLWRVISGNRREFVKMGLPPLLSGWVDLDKLNYARFWDAILSSAFPDSGKGRINPSQLESASSAVSERLKAGRLKHVLQHTILCSMAIPKMKDAIRNSCRAQVTRDQIKLACGLERYHLKHAGYPEKLERLIPEFLTEMPSDPFTGDPYKFGRTANGRYAIWSVGWDVKDDGGVPTPKGHDDKGGDWGWQYL